MRWDDGIKIVVVIVPCVEGIILSSVSKNAPRYFNASCAAGCGHRSVGIHGACPLGGCRRKGGHERSHSQAGRGPLPCARRSPNPNSDPALVKNARGGGGDPGPGTVSVEQSHRHRPLSRGARQAFRAQTRPRQQGDHRVYRCSAVSSFTKLGLLSRNVGRGRSSYGCGMIHTSLRGLSASTSF